MESDHDAGTDCRPLPPGQRPLDEFPRFGVAQFARRPLRNRDIRLQITGAPGSVMVLTSVELATLPRVSIAADFHCAAGWSYRNVTWSGVRFRDLWARFIEPNTQGCGQTSLVVLRCQDGYRTSLPLADLLAPEVLIADQLDGRGLTIEHGAPVRLIAPAHYGYKNAKHLAGIELRIDAARYRPLLPALLDHPRARVALEERGQFLPGWLLRWMFRPFIKPLIRKVQDAAAQSANHQDANRLPD